MNINTCCVQLVYVHEPRIGAKVKRIPLLFSLFFLTSLAQSLEASDLSGPQQPAGLLGTETADQETEIRPGSVALTRREIDSLIYDKFTKYSLVDMFQTKKRGLEDPFKDCVNSPIYDLQ